MKFGGTSVKDAEAIHRVISIVRGRMQERPLVVVSALSKVTRLLCSIAEDAEVRHLNEVNDGLDALRDRHMSLAAELLSGDGDILAGCIADINSLCDSLADFVHGVCQIGELSPRSYARIVSTGELLSSRIVAAAMNVEGVSCRWQDARELIVTDCNYTSAVPDMAVTEANVRRLVPEACKGVSVVLTQGFIGSSTEGSPSVLGFEGSDYSAAIFGMALDAERVEIWTDVDGIRSADPRKVDTTLGIDRISYSEASEMAFLGARVLHPLTIEPARKKNIPVYVLNSMAPDHSGSVVAHDVMSAGPKTVALKDDIEYIEIVSSRIIGIAAMLARIFGVIGKYGLKVCLVASSESSVKFTVEEKQGSFEDVVASLRSEFDVMVYHDKAQVSVVGRNVALTEHLQETMLQAIGGAKVHMASQSASLLSTSFVVDKADADRIVANLHRLIFENR